MAGSVDNPDGEVFTSHLMANRVQRLAAALAAVTLIVGGACSSEQDDDGTTGTDLAPSTAGPGDESNPATTSTSVPGSGSGTPTTEAQGAATPGAGTARTDTRAAPGATTAALTAALTGEAEVPDPGIAGGTGVATLRIAGMQLCYTLNAPIAEKPLVAHIHKGAAGEAGDIVINFEVVFQKKASAFVAEKCLNKDPALLAGIIANPAAFYVNIHTGEHPKGAIRGQLEASS